MSEKEKPLTLKDLQAVITDLRSEQKQDQEKLRSEQKQDQEKLRTNLRAEFRQDMGNTLLKFYNEVIDPRFTRLEKSVEQVDTKVEALKSDVKILKSDMGELKSDINNHFDELYKKFESLEQEYVVVKHQMKRMDGALDDIQALKQKVKDLSDQVAALERKALRH